MSCSNCLFWKPDELGRCDKLKEMVVSNGIIRTQRDFSCTLWKENEKVTSLIFTVDGLLAKEILNVYSYWVYYDTGYSGMSLYFSGTKDYPISNYTLAKESWCRCTTSTSVYDEQIIPEGEYSFKIKLYSEHENKKEVMEDLIKEANERISKRSKK